MRILPTPPAAPMDEANPCRDGVGIHRVDAPARAGRSRYQSLAGPPNAREPRRRRSAGTPTARIGGAARGEADRVPAEVSISLS